MDEAMGEHWPDARQQPQRLQRMLNVTLHAPRFGAAGAVVRNISATGLGGTSKQWLAAGEEVGIELPHLGRVAGRIAWAHGTRFGMRFDGAIDPSRVTREAAPGMDRSFHVMDRYRPVDRARRPGIAMP
ncbi:MAG: PilZ domain-containing protein [Sphingomonas sp.]